MLCSVLSILIKKLIFLCFDKKILISEHIFLSLLLNLHFQISNKIFKILHVLSNLQKDTNSSFNTIEDSGIDAKFVNVVYDALLNTVSRKKDSCFIPLYQVFPR